MSAPTKSDTDLAGCTACGHVHTTMAVIWHGDDEVTLLCHEDDHSCYESFQQVPAWAAGEPEGDAQ